MNNDVMQCSYSIQYTSA